MIALDTNVLIYAHREELPQHALALASLNDAVDTGRPIGIPWPCVHEFLAVTTNRRAFSPPTPTDAAMRTVSELLASHNVRALSEAPGHLERMAMLIDRGHVAGPKIHDARIAAICLGHGVEALWTADRDFSYFPELVTHNPLVA